MMHLSRGGIETARAGGWFCLNKSWRLHGLALRLNCSSSCRNSQQISAPQLAELTITTGLGGSRKILCFKSLIRNKHRSKGLSLKFIHYSEWLKKFSVENTILGTGEKKILFA